MDDPKSDLDANTAAPSEEPHKPAQQRRGFAAMSKEQRRLIAIKGGKQAHVKGTAHVFTSEEAKSAGRKGGIAVSKNREHMQRIGAKGGKGRSKPALVEQPQPAPEGPKP